MDPKDERDGDGDGEDRDEEKESAEAEETERESSEPPPPKSEAKPGKSLESKPARTGKAKREGKSRAQDAPKRVSATTSPSKVSSQAIVIAIIALAAGGAAGWFGHQ